MNLRDWLDQECMEIKQLAGRINVSRHAIYGWLAGTRKPIRVHRALIQKLTKGQVKIEEWENNGQGITDGCVQSSKKDELRSKKCMDAVSAPKSKIRLKRR